MEQSLSANGLDCPTAEVGEYCFRVRKYSGGKYQCLFHKHVKRHRISSEMRIALLKALVVQFDGINSDQLFQSFLNGRGKNPPRERVLDIHVDYLPNRATGYFCGGDVEASCIMRHAARSDQ